MEAVQREKNWWFALFGRVNKQRLSCLSVAFLCGLVWGCNSTDPVDGTTPYLVSFSVVSGNHQTGFIDEILGEPVVVRLLDASGTPIEREVVQFDPEEGGTVEATTNSLGLASFQWRLGAAYEQRLTAIHNSSDGVNATANAYATARYRYREPDGLGEWPTRHATNLNVDSDDLMQLIDAIRSSYYPNVHAVLLARNGELFLEETFQRTGETDYTGSDAELHYVASVTKSFTATLLGIALDEGLIGNVDEPLYSFFPEYQSFNNWSDYKDSITIRDALMMRSGLACADDGSWESTSDFVKTTLDLPDRKSVV